jgi:hypothetical protein
MKRREYIALIGGAAVAAWPLAASAQRTGKLPTIGYIGGGAVIFGPWTAAFVERLSELGWIDGPPSHLRLAGRKVAPSALPR